jgi:hypothetical protein
MVTSVSDMSDPTALPNFPPPANEHPLRGRVLDVLIDLGLQPDIDSDGDVAFVVNDQQLFARCVEGELPVLRVFGQWRLPEQAGADPVALLAACNDLNLSHNCVKTGLAQDTLVVTSEHLAPQGADVAVLTQVAVQAVLGAVAAWHEHVFGGNAEGAEGADSADGVDGVAGEEPQP